MHYPERYDPIAFHEYLLANEEWRNCSCEGGEEELPEKLWLLLDPWRCARPGWMGLGTAWDSGSCPCPRQGWNLSIPNHSGVLWKYLGENGQGMLGSGSESSAALVKAVTNTIRANYKTEARVKFKDEEKKERRRSSELQCLFSQGAITCDRAQLS